MSMIFRVRDMIASIFNLSKPHQKPIQQQPFNKYSSVLHTQIGLKQKCKSDISTNMAIKSPTNSTQIFKRTNVNVFHEQTKRREVLRESLNVEKQINKKRPIIQYGVSLFGGATMHAEVNHLAEVRYAMEPRQQHQLVPCPIPQLARP